MSYLKDLEKKYNEQANKRKIKIRLQSNRFKRFWMWVWYFIAFPFVWLFYNIRDWRSVVIFAIVAVILSSEVWVPYLIGVICWSNKALRITMFSIGSACWLFWLGPGTPFMIICIGVTIFIKGLFNKIHSRKKKRK